MGKIEKYFELIIIIVIPLLYSGIEVSLACAWDRNTFSFDDEEMKVLLIDLNSDLPRKIGTIGTQDSITYENKTLTYNHTVYGGKKIKKFYLDHYDDYKELIKYLIVAMNGQNNNGRKLAECFYQRGLNACVRIYTGLDEPVSWTVKGTELKVFADSCKTDPTEALKMTIDMMLKFSNMSLPLQPDETPYPDNIFTNSMTLGYDKACLPQSLERIGNMIVLTISLDEKEYDISSLKENLQYDEYIDNLAKLLSEDDDMKEFFGMLALSHSDFAFQYIGRQNKDTVLVKLPYTILRKHCSVPSELLSEY